MLVAQMLFAGAFLIVLIYPAVQVMLGFRLESGGVNGWLKEEKQ